MAKIFMSETRKNLLLFTFILRIYFSFGFSVDLSGSSPYAVLNQPYTLTCTVKEAANLDDHVDFYNKTESTTVSKCSLHQTTSQCYVFIPALKGYTASCGTHSASDSTKSYTLKIHSVTEKDATDWCCRLNTAATNSNVISLLVNDESKSGTWCIRCSVLNSVLIVGVFIISF